MLELETVLAIVIILITINLLIVGFYIILVLRDARRTVRKAESVIDEVDQSVKSGIEKAEALHVPLQALAVTTTALTGVIKGSNLIRKATQSIAGDNVDKTSTNDNREDLSNEETQQNNKPKTKKPKPRFFRKKG